MQKTESELIKSELRTSISGHPNICLNLLIVLGDSDHVRVVSDLVRSSDIYRVLLCFQSIRSSESERSTSDQLVFRPRFNHPLRGHKPPGHTCISEKAQQTEQTGSHLPK